MAAGVPSGRVIALTRGGGDQHRHHRGVGRQGAAELGEEFRRSLERAASTSDAGRADHADPAHRRRHRRGGLVRPAGFTTDWEHRFEPGLPLFVSISRGPMRIFLSEHRGDARPDTLIYLRVHDVDSIAAEFGQSIQDQPWGPELELRTHRTTHGSPKPAPRHRPGTDRHPRHRRAPGAGRSRTRSPTLGRLGRHRRPGGGAGQGRPHRPRLTRTPPGQGPLEDPLTAGQRTGTPSPRLIRRSPPRRCSRTPHARMLHPAPTSFGARSKTTATAAWA